MTPELPALTGNGLAMRAGVTLCALASVGAVTVVVIGEAGRVFGETDDAFIDQYAADLVVHRPEALDARSVALDWLGTSDGRARVAALDPMPLEVRHASPSPVAGLAARVEVASPGPFDVVHVLRLRCAPWATPFLSMGSPTSVLDLDDDEFATRASLADECERRGDPALAETYRADAAATGRLADVELPRFDAVLVASPADVEAVARHGNPNVLEFPNAIVVSDAVIEPRPAADFARLLFVGNLTYLPNIWAADWFVEEVLPLVQVRCNRPVELVLVGRASPEVQSLAGDRVLVEGYVDDIAQWYQAADVAIVPLTVGGGTRIKVLEAFARSVPVVSTSLGVEGLVVEDGVHALIADDAATFAGACCQALADRAASAARTVHAHHLVRTAFAVEDVAARLASIHLGLLAE